MNGVGDNEKNIAIICDGTEIAYGMNLLHLIKYVEEDNFVMCKKYKDFNAEIYTVKYFEREKKLLDTYNIYIGKAGRLVGKSIFERFGISIWVNEKNLVCKSDIGTLGDKEYEGFLNYANGLRKEYLNKEKEYVKAVSDCNPNWIVHEFKPVNSSGMFSRNSKQKERLQQLYECAALVLFNEVMSNID